MVGDVTKASTFAKLDILASKCDANSTGQRDDLGYLK